MKFSPPNKIRYMLDRLEEENPEALLIGNEHEREEYGYDRAIIGLGCQYSRPLLPIYSYSLLVNVFCEMFSKNSPEDEDYDPHEAAVEWVDFNVVGAWMGEGTPIIVQDCEEMLWGA